MKQASYFNEQEINSCFGQHVFAGNGTSGRLRHIRDIPSDNHQ